MYSPTVQYFVLKSHSEFRGLRDAPDIQFCFRLWSSGFLNLHSPHSFGVSCSVVVRGSTFHTGTNSRNYYRLRHRESTSPFIPTCMSSTYCCFEVADIFVTAIRNDTSGANNTHPPFPSDFHYFSARALSHSTAIGLSSPFPRASRLAPPSPPQPPEEYYYLRLSNREVFCHPA